MYPYLNTFTLRMNMAKMDMVAAWAYMKIKTTMLSSSSGHESGVELSKNTAFNKKRYGYEKSH